MKTLSFTQLLAASLGALLVWAAITGQSPAQIMKNAFGVASTPAGNPNALNDALTGKSPVGGNN